MRHFYLKLATFSYQATNINSPFKLKQQYERNYKANLAVVLKSVRLYMRIIKYIDKKFLYSPFSCIRLSFLLDTGETTPIYLICALAPCATDGFPYESA